MWNQRRHAGVHLKQQWLEELSQEETEELGFVPSAVREPQWALHVYENKCREESFKFFQLVAIVTEEGGAAHTINLCKQCYNERLLKQGEQPVKVAQWRADRAKHLSEKVMGGLWYGAISTKKLEALRRQESMGQSSPGGCGKTKTRRHTRQLAKRSHHAKRSWNWSSVAVI